MSEGIIKEQNKEIGFTEFDVFIYSTMDICKINYNNNKTKKLFNV
jgi:hypothetical protein